MKSTSKDQEKSTLRGSQFTSKQSIPNDQATLGTFVIRQSVPTDSIRKGPNVNLRSTALNEDIPFKRAFGEGTNPLFEREDVFANAIDDNESGFEESFTKGSVKSVEIDPSTSQSSYQRNVKKTKSTIVGTQSKRTEYQHRGCCGKPPPISKSSNKSANEKRTTTPIKNKLPYYRDEVRERDRLRRLYGDSRRYKSRSLSPDRSNKDSSRRRNRSASRDKHRDYSPYKRTRSNSTHRSHRTRTRRSRSHSSHRERSRHKQSSRRSRDRDSQSPCCSHRRRLNDDHSSRRSHSSPGQHARSSRDSANDSEIKNCERHEPIQIPTPSTYIPVPVPVPDYAFSYPHWPVHQNPWMPHIPHRGPPTYPYGFPLMPIIPPLRPMHPIRYAGPPPPMPYPPMAIAPYRSRPGYRYPHSKQQNVANNQNRNKHADRHK